MGDRAADSSGICRSFFFPRTAFFGSPRLSARLKHLDPYPLRAILLDAGRFARRLREVDDPSVDVRSPVVNDDIDVRARIQVRDTDTCASFSFTASRGR
jgi:hypothetical protein